MITEKKLLHQWPVAAIGTGSTSTWQQGCATLDLRQFPLPPRNTRIATTSAGVSAITIDQYTSVCFFPTEIASGISSNQKQKKLILAPPEPEIGFHVKEDAVAIASKHDGRAELWPSQSSAFRDTIS